MKEIHFDISIPIKGLQDGQKFTIHIKDDGNFVEALAMVDKQVSENPQKSIFPLYDGYIHNYLQLFVNLEDESVYEDVGLTAYGPDEKGNLTKFNPVQQNIKFSLFPDTEINLQPDAGC